MELSKKLKAGVQSRHSQLYSMSITRDGVCYADMAINSLPSSTSAAARQSVAHIPGDDRNPNKNLSNWEKAIFDINVRLNPSHD